jgi:hypothetical protein
MFFLSKHLIKKKKKFILFSKLIEKKLNKQLAEKKNK